MKDLADDPWSFGSRRRNGPRKRAPAAPPGQVTYSPYLSVPATKSPEPSGLTGCQPDTSEYCTCLRQ
jgi:hypothetical protein